MIPIKLELKNFLSYGDRVITLDFTNHSLICLSGKNGNGKSALLDAITWSLWGHARKVSGTIKADAGLLRLGQTRMMVSLEFIANKQRYRVRREYAKTYGKPYAALDVELFNEESDSFVSLSEKTIKQTQAKIEKIVGLDFETFANSAFIRQGQSNEFSQKTPKERKQILANILGLSRYDKLQKSALEHARRYVDEHKVLIKLQEQVVQELEEESSCKSDLKVKENIIRQAEKDIEKTQEELEKIEKERITILEKKYQYEQACQEQKKLAEQRQQKEDELQVLVLEWKKNNRKIIAAKDSSSVEKKYKELLEQEKKIREIQQQDLALQEKIFSQRETYQKGITEQKEAFDKNIQKKTLEVEKVVLEHAQLCKLLEMKEKDLAENKEKQEKEKDEERKILKDLKKEQLFCEQLEADKKKFEKGRLFYQRWIEKGNRLKRELYELEQKKVVVHDKKNPSCPLCDQVLTVKRKQFLAKRFQVDGTFLSHRIVRLTKLLKNLKERLLLQHEEQKRSSFRVDREKQLIANYEMIKRSLKELERIYKRISVELDALRVRALSEEKKLALLRKELETQKNESVDNKTVKNLEKQLVALEKERKKLAYNKNEHAELQKELSSYELLVTELDAYKKIEAEQKERKSFVARICKELKAYKKQAKELDKKKQMLSYDNEKEKKINESISSLKEKQRALLKEKELGLQEKGKLESKMQRYAVLKKESKKREKKIEEKGREAKEYQTLATIFGKDGIQALLIEDAIPEVEQEANLLLSQLTNNKSQVFIESLRDLKKGGVKESLDIHISDSAGIRPYEMFSGGEAFRIDFALRIAISKLLARRAGASLQTLIIDEGFGSQDEDGLQRLMDALHVIGKDFVKIIVVSHLPILKDNFPVHFIVQKDSLGSFVRVEERG